MIVNMFGNGTVLYMLSTRSPLRNAVNIVMGNISFADLIAGMLACLNGIARNWNKSYTFGAAYCRINPFLKDVTLNVSNVTLVVLLIERVRARLWPTVKSTTVATALTQCLLTWTIAIIAFHWEIANYANYGQTFYSLTDPQSVSYICHLKDNFFGYELSGAIITLHIPTLLSVIMTTFLLYKMRRTRLHLEGVPTLAQYDCEKKVVAVVVVNLLLTIVNWIPEQYIFLMHSDKLTESFSETLEQWYLAFHVLAAIRCTVHPFVLLLVSKSFRKELRMCCMSKDATVSTNSSQPAPPSPASAAGTLSEVSETMSLYMP